MNKIELDFASPVKYFEKMNNKHFLWTNGDTIPGAAHLRKALYMSGWDWGPTLPDMGIFRPVVLDLYDGDKIDNVYVGQHHNDGEVVLEIEVETVHGKGFDLYAEIDGQTILLENGKLVRVYDEEGRFIAIYEYQEQDRMFHIQKMFLDKSEL